MAERTDGDLRTIAENAARANGAAGTPARQIGDFYRSAMDEARLTALGAQPVRPQLDRFAGIRSREEFAFEAGRLTSLMAGGPFGNSIVVDATDSARLLVEIPQGGTMLPNRDYLPEYRRRIRRAARQWTGEPPAGVLRGVRRHRQRPAVSVAGNTRAYVVKGR
jgi:putative endopeptidase